MSENYKRVPTSAEVWAVIKARHGAELKVFGTVSEPQRGLMETGYGFQDADYPLMEARTTWEVDPECDWKRVNEKHEYWLCFAKEPA